MSEVTEREKVIISFAVLQILQGCKPNWQLLYILSRDKAVISLIPNPATAQRATNWKNSAKVMDFFRAEKSRLEAWVSDLQGYARKEALLTKDTQPNCKEGAIAPKNGACAGEVQNYAERESMLAELNKIANLARDSREKLDALKIIADLQRFKDTATSEKPEIKRFYMPLRCQNCKLYMAAKQSKSEG